jgi:microcystin-dependent protein
MSVLLSSTLANPTTSYYALAGAGGGGVSQIVAGDASITVSSVPPGGTGVVTISAPGAILTGMIVMWTGQFVPLGYSLCNGGNGTPDLQNRFIIAAAVPGSGAPQTYPAGTSGGVASVSLVVNNLPDHQHGGAAVLGSGGTAGINDYNVSGIGGNTTGISSVGYVSPGGTPFDIIPPYYALAFIMKL